MNFCLFFPFPVYALDLSFFTFRRFRTYFFSPASGWVSKTLPHTLDFCQELLSVFFFFIENSSKPSFWQRFFYKREKSLAATYFPAVAAVSSALEGLTSVFGMGTGISPPLWPPGIISLSSWWRQHVPDLSFRTSAFTFSCLTEPFKRVQEIKFHPSKKTIIWSSLTTY